MFQFNSLKDKLQEGVGGAFSLDHLQDGDDWMEEEGSEGTPEGNQENINKIIEDVKPLNHPEVKEYDRIEEQTPTISETIRIDPKTKPMEPIDLVEKPQENIKVEVVEEDVVVAAAPNQSTQERAAKVISAAKAASSFFSLDTMQEDDPWMGKQNKEINNEPFEIPHGGMGVDDDSEESDAEDTMMTLHFGQSQKTQSTLLSSVSAAAAAAAASHPVGLQSLQDVTRLEDAEEANGVLSELLNHHEVNDIHIDNNEGSSIIEPNESVAKDDGKEVWVPKYDRVASMVSKPNDEEERWKPPPPLPVVNPFEDTHDDLPQTPNPYLSGLRLSHLEKGGINSIHSSNQTTSAIREGGEEGEEDNEDNGNGKRSWFRRTADRDALRLMGESFGQVKASFGSMMGNQTLDMEHGPATSTAYSGSRLESLGSWPSAMRATRAKIDHFGLLLEKEKGIVSPYFLDLVSGRAKLRLSTVNKFQIAVVVAGLFLTYFYYSMSSYFVLT